MTFVSRCYLGPQHRSRCNPRRHRASFHAVVAATISISVIPTAAIAEQSDHASEHRNWALGTCLGKQKESARHLLATLPLSGEEGVAFKSFSFGACIVQGEKMDFRYSDIRAGVSEKLAEQLSHAFIKPSRVFVAPVNGEQANLSESSKDYLALVLFGECVASKDLGGVLSVLETDPQSGREREAITQLFPLFGQCVPPDAQFKINRLTMRRYLAEGAYRYQVAKLESNDA